MAEWTFEVDAVPASANELARGQQMALRRKRYAAHRDRWTWEFVLHFLKADQPAPTGRREVEVTFYFDKPARRDPQNFMSKGFIDALVLAGWLKDDSPEWASLLPAQCVYDAERGPATVVVIREID